MEKCLSAAAVAVLIFAIAGSIESVKGETFYIVTTPGSPFCNESGYERAPNDNGSGVGQHCLTLPQFVARFVSDELSAYTNFTLELEPGEHMLDSILTVANVVSFVMTSEAATINCTSDLKFFGLVSLEDVLISGITFMECGWIRVLNIDNFRFENSSFQVVEYDYPYSLTLDSVINIAIIGSTFSQNLNNGVLYIRGGSSTIHIQQCSFSHLKENAIYSENSTVLIIDSSTFENIALDESSYLGTAVEIVNNQGSVNITNCDFINNSIGNHTDTQGLFSVDSRGPIVIRGNRFTQNTGGVLNVSSIDETTIDQNSFINNTGPGAALYINAKSVPLKITWNNFTDNTDGAMKLLVSDSRVIVGDCSFSNNTDYENGGAAMTVYEHDDNYLYYGSNELRILRSSFFNNSANNNGSGGALHIKVDSPLTVSSVYINASIFRRNRAPRGGALYFEGSANSSFGTQFTIFDNNMATEGHAGAIVVEGDKKQLVFLLGSTYTNNTAPHGCAGVAYIDAGDTLVQDSTFLNNTAQNCGVLTLNSGCIETQDSNFLSNRALTDGGVICASADMNDCRIVIDGNFSYNHAERNGGVVIVEPRESERYVNNKNVSFHIHGSAYFGHNTAGSQGGVFAVYAPSDFIIGGSFLNNQAGVEGGVMYVGDTNSSVKIPSILIGFNSAAQRGGVFSINGSSMFIGGATIFNNSADMGPIISACGSDVGFFPPDSLFQYNDPNFPTCLLYDVIEHKSSTTAAVTTVTTVTTPTIPPTRANRSSSRIAVAVAVPMVCLLVVALVAAALAFAYWRGYLKCKKSVSIGHYGVKKMETDDPDLAPLMDNA